MVALSGFLIVLSILGIIFSLLWLGVAFFKGKRLKFPLLLSLGCFVSFFVFTFIGNALTTDEDRAAMAAREFSMAIEREESNKAKEQSESQKKEEESKKRKDLEESIRESVVESMSTGRQEYTIVQESAITESASEELKENIVDNNSLSEEDYKLACKEMWYDDIFFSKEDLEGKFVKLDIYFEEGRFFTMDSVYDSRVQKLKDEWNTYMNFYLCGVSRGEPNSYVGGQINVFFSQDYGISPDNYDTGQQAIAYGQIIDYSSNTWSGYNECSFIPKYIELK
ncbi:hypothetical protein [Lacrimispora brassicae]